MCLSYPEGMETAVPHFDCRAERSYGVVEEAQLEAGRVYAGRSLGRVVAACQGNYSGDPWAHLAAGDAFVVGDTGKADRHRRAANSCWPYLQLNASLTLSQCCGQIIRQQRGKRGEGDQRRNSTLGVESADVARRGGGKGSRRRRSRRSFGIGEAEETHTHHVTWMPARYRGGRSELRGGKQRPNTSSPRMPPLLPTYLLATQPLLPFGVQRCILYIPTSLSFSSCICVIAGLFSSQVAAFPT